jgi:hypothetical protein
MTSAESDLPPRAVETVGRVLTRQRATSSQEQWQLTLQIRLSTFDRFLEMLVVSCWLVYVQQTGLCCTLQHPQGTDCFEMSSLLF